MDEKTKSIIKKVVIGVVIALVLFCAGVCVGRCSISTPTNTELSEELAAARAEITELKQRLDITTGKLTAMSKNYEDLHKQYKQLEDDAAGVKKQIDECEGLADQAGESLGRAGQTIRDARTSASGGREIISQLRKACQTAEDTIDRLQGEVDILRGKLKDIKSGTSK